MLRVNQISGFGGKRSGASYDSDAQAFFTAAGITDNTQKTAVDALVTALKGYSIWTKMQALYPFVGGTSTTHKYNLKDPQDTDGAFRIVWGGTVTHNANGITGNGSDAYGDTKYNHSTNGTLDSEHVSVYSRTTGGDDGRDIGAVVATGTILTCRDSVNRIWSFSQNASTGTTANSDGSGMFILSRTGSGSYYLQRNATEATVSNASSAKANANYYILARNNSGSAANFSPRNLAFASIGTGLDTTEMDNLNTAVQAFQTTLGRNV